MKRGMTFLDALTHNIPRPRVDVSDLNDEMPFAGTQDAESITGEAAQSETAHTETTVIEDIPAWGKQLQENVAELAMVQLMDTLSDIEKNHKERALADHTQKHCAQIRDLKTDVDSLNEMTSLLLLSNIALSQENKAIKGTLNNMTFGVLALATAAMAYYIDAGAAEQGWSGPDRAIAQLGVMTLGKTLDSVILGTSSPLNTAYNALFGNKTPANDEPEVQVRFGVRNPQPY